MLKPTYDWEWFLSHTPFKKIMEEQCNLKISWQWKDISVLGYFPHIRKVYYINYDEFMFTQNWEQIKSLLLKTKVCQNNIDIYEYIFNMNGDVSSINDIVIQGCIKNASGYFIWNYKENKHNE